MLFYEFNDFTNEEIQQYKSTYDSKPWVDMIKDNWYKHSGDQEQDYCKNKSVLFVHNDENKNDQGFVYQAH